MTTTIDAQDALNALLHKPECLPFLPMIYVAWADGELSEAEVQSIRRHVPMEGLGAEAQLVLNRWLDPEAPPTSTMLLRMLRGIREAAGAEGFDTNARISLTELGLRIAQIDHLDAASVQSTRQALEELERALGVVGAEVVQDVLDDGEVDLDAPEEDLVVLEGPPGFDVAAMTRLLDGAHHEMHQRVRQLLHDPQFRYQYELPKAEYRELVLSWLKRLGDEGFGQKAFPGVFEGSGDLGEFISAFEALGAFDLSLVVKFGVQFGLWGGSVYFLGTEKHHKRWLPDVASVALPGAFAMTELGHGSNVRDLGTTATFDPDAQEWIIHTPDELSRKEWIGNAACHARMATVFAQLIVNGERHGVHALVVPVRDAHGDTMPGVSVQDCGHKLGLNGVDNGRLWFDQVRVPRDHLLDRFAQVGEDGVYHSPIASSGKRFFTMLSTLVAGRVSVASAASTAAKSALTIAIRYGALRRQFGPSSGPEVPLLDYRTHQRRLMPLLARTYALNFALHDLIVRYARHDEDDARQIEALAAGLKAYSTWHTTHTIQTARECCGGQGYLTLNRFAHLKADTDIFTTFEGDNTVLMQLVAKSLLDEFRQQFQEFSFMRMVRFVADQASARLPSLDPLTPRRTDREHLRDATFHGALLRSRESLLVTSVAARFKKRLDAEMDSFDALIDVQDHMVAAAHAHIERVIFERFREAIDATEDEAVRARLERLSALNVLRSVEQDMGWFMENGFVEAPKASAIRGEVNMLCAEVREEAVHLVAAFALPEPAIGAPIASTTIVR